MPDTTPDQALRESAGAGARVRPRAAAARLHQLHEAVRFAFPQRKAIVGILVLMFSVAVVNAIEPLVLKGVFDELTTDRQVGALVVSIGLLAGLAAGREIMNGAGNWLSWRTRISLQYALLEATVGKLHRMPLRMQRSEGVGAIITKLDRSIQSFVAALSLILFNILPSVMFLSVAIWIMFGLDWRLALLAIAFAPMPGLIAFGAAPEQMRRERDLLDRWSRIYSRFNEVLAGIVTVRSFAMEDAEKKRFLDDVATANRVVVRGVATDSGYSAASNLVVALARLSAIALGGWLVLEQSITVGTLVAFLGYIGGLFTPVQGLSSVYSSVRKAQVALDEIFGILNLQEHLGDAPDAVDLQDVKGAVELEHVSFSYGLADRPVLCDISVRVSPGETVAVVGPSGSGKTTLMALLMRFYDPEAGRILLDGWDLRSIRQSSLRRNIGAVLQDPLLFNDTVRANIAYGRPEARDDEIVSAAKAAFAHEFISRLPNGYDTVVGERGGLLSGGERQRITIARAILKDPSILVLDEATSALDAESEEAVQRGIEALIEGRTTFVIAHRLSTVVNADRIMVLKDGRLIECGRHAELMRLNGYYASLVARQSRGLILNDA